MKKSTKTRALTDAEVELMADSFYGKYEYRDRALFLLGVRTGYRISELLRPKFRPMRMDFYTDPSGRKIPLLLSLIYLTRSIDAPGNLLTG